MSEQVIDDPLDVLDEQPAQARYLLRVQIVTGNHLPDVGETGWRGGAGRPGFYAGGLTVVGRVRQGVQGFRVVPAG